GYADPLTTEEINDIRREEPKWLVIERQVAQEVKAEDERIAKEARLKAEKAARRAKREER
ncbi:DUF5997 family protein, partial [Timonella senegalensis]